MIWHVFSALKPQYYPLNFYFDTKREWRL